MGDVGGRRFSVGEFHAASKTLSANGSHGKTSSANVPPLNVWGFDISAAEFPQPKKNARLWCDICDDSMRNSNFGIGVLHVKLQILTIFCDVISLLVQVFIVFHLIQIGVYQKILRCLCFCDMIVPSKSNVPSP